MSLPTKTKPPMMSSGFGVKALRITSLVVGCLGVGISYIVNAFNIFALALKARFYLNQIEFEVLLAVAFLGLCASLPGGMILDRFGARWASLLALIISTAGYLMVWSATLEPEYYRDNFYLLVMYFLVAGIGGGLTYISATASNVRNFSDRMRGTIVGVLHACMSTGPALIMFVYDSFFLQGHVVDVEKQDLSGFFVFITVSFGVINLLGIGFYGHYPPNNPEEEALIMDSGPRSDGESLLKEKRDLERSQRSLVLTGSTMKLNVPHSTPTKRERPDLLTLDYQLLFWPFIILTALQMMFIQNMTIVLVSFNQTEYTVIFPFLTPVLGTVAKPIMGMLSDMAIRYVPRISFIIISGVASVICWLLASYLINYISIVVVVVVLCDMVAYTVYTIGPALIIEHFGLATFSNNWGLVMGGFSVMTSMLFFLFGTVYDKKSVEGTELCEGLHCYYITFMVSAGISVIALVCSIWYYVRNRQPKEYRPQPTE